MSTTDRLAALLHDDPEIGHGTPFEALITYSALAARLAAAGVTVGIDAERLAWALRIAATYTAPAAHGRPEAREEQRLWYHGAIADLAAIARAYEEASDATD